MMKGAADASERLLLVLVLVVAAVGVAAPAPGRALAAGNGIDATLAVLVFSTGLSLRLADLAAVRLAWRRIAVVLLVSTAALPALAWAASLLIDDPVLRAGVQAAGVAPAEVATVALCVIAGGEAAVCAMLLAASTIITVMAAGPILSLLGASVTVSPAGLLGHLAVVIALPLAAGIALRTVWSPRDDAVIRLVTVLALLLLLWQVASQIRLDSAYVTVIVALVVFVAGSEALGWVLALRAPSGQATAVLLPVALRDFAVAAGIATAAFGPAAAAPLGAYGVLVLLAGSATAIIARRRPPLESALLARTFGTHRRPTCGVSGVRHRLRGPPRQLRFKTAQVDVDVHQAGRAAGRSRRQHRPGHGVAAQVRVARLGHPHGQLSHLRADLRDLQRYDRRAPQGLPALVGLPRQAERLEHGGVGLRVHIGQVGRAAAQLVSLVRHIAGLGKLPRREPRRHADEPGRHRAGHRRRPAATRGRRAGRELIQETPHRPVQERVRGRAHDRPTTMPSSSRSMRAAAGFELSPGIVRMSPQIGYTKPAPTDARTSRTGRVQPVGAPLSAGSEEIDRCVLAMHTGRCPKPARS